jgi:hypothetical protein
MSYDLDIAEDVDRFGFSLLTISDVTPGFAYTVGLMFTEKHPELIIFGRDPDELSAILRCMIDQIRQGRSFADRKSYSIACADFPVATRRVHPSQYEYYLGFAMGYCTNNGRMGELEALQAFWPDKHGRFPFDRGCDEAVWAAQPRLDQPVLPDEARERRRAIGDR